MYNNPYMQPQYGRYMPETQYSNQVLPQYNQQPTSIIQKTSLQGKIIDSIDVVKSMDIPLDGSISFFPLADGSSIATKQLQADGTSKVIIYKPIIEEEQEVRYVTRDDLKAYMKDFNNDDIEDIKDDIKELKKDIKSLKGKEK